MTYRDFQSITGDRVKDLLLNLPVVIFALILAFSFPSNQSHGSVTFEMTLVITSLYVVVLAVLWIRRLMWLFKNNVQQGKEK